MSLRRLAMSESTNSQLSLQTHSPLSPTPSTPPNNLKQKSNEANDASKSAPISCMNILLILRITLRHLLVISPLSPDVVNCLNNKPVNISSTPSTTSVATTGDENMGLSDSYSSTTPIQLETPGSKAIRVPSSTYNLKSTSTLSHYAATIRQSLLEFPSQLPHHLQLLYSRPEDWKLLNWTHRFDPSFKDSHTISLFSSFALHGIRFP
ncbi:hypothetical protein BCR33DRAFT_852208 [Rhizoclosmatium globosum]|uniref:Uncharacterized protein n=1 Tax=Rhizoclosmatium globosum TaxID=329046 RepID=A0A1Y2C3U7_9FUNG|nr:hypothetical protein BCR33DRAFT_852208 [Rhizoclosmatium globosum]|eukprot:ORY41723.1 hypothetical protein BCR33DRAFT_852208 [Rhizoclosmatium globosum]